MLFDVAYPFTARYLLRRHRNPTWMSHVGRMTLDIPEVGEADFPAGFLVRTVDLEKPAAEVAVRRFDIRIHDDACWWPLRGSDGDLVGIGRFRQAAAEGGFLYDTATRFSGRQLVGTRNMFPREPLPEMAIKELLESDEEAIKLALQRRAAEHLKVFDGKLYVRGNEPVLLLKFADRHRGTRQVSVVLAEDIDAAALERDGSLVPKVFRVDEAEMASSLAERAMKAQKTRKPPIETCKVDIVPSPYRLRFDPATAALLRAARRIREEACKVRVIEETGIPREAVMAATDPSEPWRLAETLKPVVERLRAVEDAAGRRSPATTSALYAIDRAEGALRDGRLSTPDDEAIAALAG